MQLNISKNSVISPKSKQPTISIVIPTLNSAKVLDNCLESIVTQNYPHKLITILIVDGGSTDNTISISKKYKCKIIKNPLKSAEAGKAIGVKNVNTDYIGLIDSDNILPSNDWLSKMLQPFEENLNIIGSEPWEYSYRPKAGFIERYSSLTGVNDPYTLIAGNYDRKSILNNQWTQIDLAIEDYSNYQLATLKPNQLLPTIGANGTIFKTSFIKKYFQSDYFFDIDIIESALIKDKIPLYFAKVKIGIIHTYCESSINKFIRKQLRRATDMYVLNHQRQYSLTKNNLLPSIKYTFYVIFIFPVIYDTVRGFIKKPDTAWFFHPLACILTLLIYGIITIKYYFGLLKPLNRSNYQQ